MNVKVKQKMGLIYLVLAFILMLTACSNDGGMSQVAKLNKIVGTVTYNDQAEAGVSVTISELNKSTTTDENGLYQFSDIQDGTYTLLFFKESNPDINNIVRTIVASGGNTFTVDLTLPEETTINDAHALVDNVNNTGIQFSTAMDAQMEKVENNLIGDDGVVGYLDSFGMKMLYTGIIFNFWMGGNDGNMLEPGEYTLDADGLVTSQPYLTTERLWKWDITVIDGYFADTVDTAHIELINPAEVVKTDVDGKITEIDYTDAEFTYSHVMDNTPNIYHLQMSYSLVLESTELITLTGEATDENGQTYTYPIYYPRKAGFNVQGAMTDNVQFTFTSEEDPMATYIYPPTGNSTIDGTLSIDLITNNTLTFDGLFDSEKIDFMGNMEIGLSSSPASFDQFNPNLFSSFAISGSAETAAARIEGGLIVKGQEHLGKLVMTELTLDGAYEDLDNPATTENEHTVSLDGLFSLYVNYEHVSDYLAEINESNYFEYDSHFGGNFAKVNFAPISLTIDIDQTGYETGTANLLYTLGNDRFVNLEYVYNGQNSIDTFTAYNEKGLQINLRYDHTVDYGLQPEKVGEIKNRDGSEIYAEIMYYDYQLTVNFIDNTTQSLLF